MKTRIYEYIIAVAEEKNITKAAEKCFISQPALTQHIKKIEKELGVVLFEKSGKEMLPTKFGELFLITANRMLQVEIETRKKIKETERTN